MMNFALKMMMFVRNHPELFNANCDYIALGHVHVFRDCTGSPPEGSTVSTRPSTPLSGLAGLG